MKKAICLVLLIVICFSSICLISACDKETKSDLTATDLSLTTMSNLIPTTSTLSIQQITNSENDIGGGFLTTRKYRVRYYSVPYQFILLVGEDAYNEWRDQIADEETDELNEMKIKRFVRHFNISREDFEKANLEFAKVLAEGVNNFPVMNPKDYADQEIDEIFNTEIIYTFDDDIINEYYLSPDYNFGMWVEYKEAVANGTYETRTTEFIDIEQMEAEIIAKYGEAEIVTEATTSIIEETTEVIPNETEITE